MVYAVPKLAIIYENRLDSHGMPCIWKFEEGDVKVRKALAGLSDEELAKVIKSKEYQIHKYLSEWTQLNEKRVECEYVNGQSFLYLGRNYRLKLVDENLDMLILRHGRLLLPKKHQEQAKAKFIQFYRQKLQEKLPDIIQQYQPQFGVTPKDVKVMELQNRWASWTPSGNINFHWKCAMAPIDVLHYIVVHELAHLIHPRI